MWRSLALVAQASAVGTYGLGYVSALDLGDVDLTFTATVTPDEVLVGDEAVGGVSYTIESAACVAG